MANIWACIRFLIGPISITYMLQPILGLENCFKIYGRNMSLYKISNWPNIYYLHVAANFRARKLLQNLWQIYESVSRFLIDPISITGTPPLTRFFGPGKNRVKGKPRYRRSILVLKPQNGEFSSSKSTFSLVFTNESAITVIAFISFIKQKET